MPDLDRETDYDLFSRLQLLATEIAAAFEAHDPLSDKEIILTDLTGLPKLGFLFGPEFTDVEVAPYYPYPMICVPNDGHHKLFGECLLHRELTFILWADYHRDEKSPKFDINNQTRTDRYFNEVPVVDAMLQVAFARLALKNDGKIPPGDLLYPFFGVMGSVIVKFSQITIEKINMRLQWFAGDNASDDLDEEAKFENHRLRTRMLRGHII